MASDIEVQVLYWNSPVQWTNRPSQREHEAIPAREPLVIQCQHEILGRSCTFLVPYTAILHTQVFDLQIVRHEKQSYPDTKSGVVQSSPDR